MLTIVDNEEFYEQEKPLSLKDIKCLIVILRQVICVVVESLGQSSSIYFSENCSLQYLI